MPLLLAQSQCLKWWAFTKLCATWRNIQLRLKPVDKYARPRPCKSSRPINFYTARPSHPVSSSTPWAVLHSALEKFFDCLLWVFFSGHLQKQNFWGSRRFIFMSLMTLMFCIILYTYCTYCSVWCHNSGYVLSSSNVKLIYAMPDHISLWYILFFLNLGFAYCIILNYIVILRLCTVLYYTHYNICHPFYSITSSKKLLGTSPKGICQSGGLKGENWIPGTILKYPCHLSDISSNLFSYLIISNDMLSYHFLLSIIPQRPVTLCLVLQHVSNMQYHIAFSSTD